MSEDPKSELPPLGLGLWIAAGVFLVMGLIALVLASKMDRGDNNLRRLSNPDSQVKHGRNRRGAVVLLGLGSAALVAALIVTLTA
jgi:hypothetical protein